MTKKQTDKRAIMAAVDRAAAPAEPEPLEAATSKPAPEPGLKSLKAMMALPEPHRTKALEKACADGATFTLRPKDGVEKTRSFGERRLTVPPQGKQFLAPHAIHLLWYLGDQLEEIPEE